MDWLQRRQLGMKKARSDDCVTLKQSLPAATVFPRSLALYYVAGAGGRGHGVERPSPAEGAMGGGGRREAAVYDTAEAGGGQEERGEEGL